MIRYLIIITYNKQCSDVIEFKTNEYMNDEYDIVSYAIRLGLMDELDIPYVRLAWAVSGYKYRYEK